MSKLDYAKMHEDQKGLCAICKKPEVTLLPKKDIPRRLAIDHCHATNKIRELLCHKCNMAIGAMSDSVEILQSAIAYLNKHGKS